MEEARPSGGALHKRKGSALDQLLGEGLAPVSGSGKAARASEPEGEPQAPAVDPRPLTETASLNLLSLRSSQQDLVEMIEQITADGLGVLDRMRANFVARMEKVKQELGALVDQVEESLRNQSVNTLELRERCQVASQLVGRLGNKVDAREQETLFSAEEEEAAGSGPAGAEGEGAEEGWQQEHTAAAAVRAAAQ